MYTCVRYVYMHVGARVDTCVHASVCPHGFVCTWYTHAVFARVVYRHMCALHGRMGACRCEVHTCMCVLTHTSHHVRWLGADSYIPSAPSRVRSRRAPELSWARRLGVPMSVTWVGGSKGVFHSHVCLLVDTHSHRTSARVKHSCVCRTRGSDPSASPPKSRHPTPTPLCVGVHVRAHGGVCACHLLVHICSDLKMYF